MRSTWRAAYRIWLGSKHSRTFVVLQRGVAMTMMGEAQPSDDDEPPVCYGCHTTAAMEPAERREMDFRFEEGVTCERCHGPGETHVIAYRDGEGKAGDDARLRIPTEDTCMGCHKSKPSHEALGKPAFDFDKYIKKIAHGETTQH